MKTNDSGAVCDTCGKYNTFVKVMIHLVDDYHICNECVDQCVNLIEEVKNKRKQEDTNETN